MGTVEEAALQRAGEDIMSKLGQSATYQPVVGDQVTCTVHYDRELSVTPEDYDVQAHGPLETIEGLLHQLGQEPNDGDKFIIGSITYIVKGILENDGIFVMCQVK